MTTTKKQIKKINEMWVQGERNKSAIMKAVGVSRKTLLKYLNQTPLQQTIPSERAKTAPELKHTHQQTVQATQSSGQLTKETHYPRKWTWEEIDEYIRPDPVSEPVYDYRFDGYDPLREQERQMQPSYYQYPEEEYQQYLHDNWIKERLTRIEEKIIKMYEQDYQESEKKFRKMNEQLKQIKNNQPDL